MNRDAFASLNRDLNVLYDFFTGDQISRNDKGKKQLGITALNKRWRHTLSGSATRLKAHEPIRRILTTLLTRSMTE